MTTPANPESEASSEPGPAAPSDGPQEDPAQSDVTKAEIIDETNEEADEELVTEPLKLVRIASMVQILLNEVRGIELDQQARERLQAVHHRTVDELRGIMSEELRTEMDNVVVPLSDAASEPELRLAQAQLAGWLEGLFHGIRASMWGQQMAQQRMLASQAQALQGLDQQASESSGGMYL